MIVASTLAVLAEDQQSELKRLIDDAGPIAGLFVLLLGIAVFLLWKSMNRQMKKIDPNLPEGPDDRERARDRRYTAEAVERGAAVDQGAAADQGAPADQGADEPPQT